MIPESALWKLFSSEISCQNKGNNGYKPGMSQNLCHCPAAKGRKIFPSETLHGCWHGCDIRSLPKITQTFVVTFRALTRHLKHPTSCSISRAEKRLRISFVFVSGRLCVVMDTECVASELCAEMQLMFRLYCDHSPKSRAQPSSSRPL